MHLLLTTRSRLSPFRCVCVCVCTLIHLSLSLGACDCVFACTHFCCISTMVQYVLESVTAHDKDGLLVHLLLHRFLFGNYCTDCQRSHFSLCSCVCTLINYADGRIDTGGGIYLWLFNHPQHINTLTNTNTESAIIRFGSVMMLMSSD